MSDSTLKHSTLDMLAFVITLRKMLDAVTKRAERRGVALPLTKELQVQIDALRDVYFRFREGDYRHSLIEQARCKALAEWTVTQHARLIGGEARPFAFVDSAMHSTRPLSPARVQAYFAAMRAANSGQSVHSGVNGNRINGHG